MTSKKLVPVPAALMIISFLIMMLYMDAAFAGLTPCEAACDKECKGKQEKFYRACYQDCVRRKCRQPTPDLDSSHAPISDPKIQYQMHCVSSKCMDDVIHPEKFQGCAKSCVADCDINQLKN